jgi:hypothetical protein
MSGDDNGPARHGLLATRSSDYSLDDLRILVTFYRDENMLLRQELKTLRKKE